MSRPLEGVRVLDFTHVLAGPFATRCLADMGADVVKINSIKRATGANDPLHPYYLMWNRNKRALALDMTHDEDRQLCERLCEQADIVIDNFSVGVLDRWGIGFEKVRQKNPRVIYIQMSGMGEGGPWSNFVTYAPTIHALSGLTYLTSVPGREDIGIGFSYNDHQAGLHAAVAILAALEARRSTGAGQHIDVSQFEVGVSFAGPSLMDLFANGRAAEPTANDLPYDDACPHNCYQGLPKGDGTLGERWIAIACMTDAHWQALKSVMGHPDWASRADFDSVAGRLEARAEIDSGIAVFTSDCEVYDLMARCQAAGVPAGVVQDGEDLNTRDPQLALYQFLHKIEDVSPLLGQTWADRLPIRFSQTPCDVYERTKAVGEDNVSVLGDWLGMDETAMRTAESKGRLQ